MAMARAAAAMAAFAVLAAVVVATSAAAEQSCVDVGKLTACKPAITGGAAPSASFCSSLRAQQGCFCLFGSDHPTAYQGYSINSPPAQKTIFASCGIVLPLCSATR